MNGLLCAVGRDLGDTCLEKEEPDLRCPPPRKALREVAPTKFARTDLLRGCFRDCGVENMA